MTYTSCLYFLERKPVHSFKMKVQTLEANVSPKGAIWKLLDTDTCSQFGAQVLCSIQQPHSRYTLQQANPQTHPQIISEV